MNILKIKKIDMTDIAAFAEILSEAAQWLISENMKNWEPSRFTVKKIIKQSNLDELYLCYVNDEAAGCLKLQDRDEMFWPGDKHGEALYVHKLAVRRKFAGKGISTYMLNWAKEQAKKAGCKFLKLDCIADRNRLCSFYENQAFRKVGERLIFDKYQTAFFEYKIVEKLNQET